MSDDQTIRMISTNSIGLSKSRNLALAHATGDIGILCDDDVIYYNDYEKIILNAFSEIEDADIIIFNIDPINFDGKVKKITQLRKLPKNKSHSSVRIAFKLEALQRNQLWFNTDFGAGSKYSSGEESILLRQAQKRGLKIYEYPATIAQVDFSDSTWREGYNKKYYYDKGAFTAAAYPKIKYIYFIYYVISLHKEKELSNFQKIKWLLRGIKGYKLNLNYASFIKYQ